MNTPLDYQPPQPSPTAPLRIPAIALLTIGGLTLLAMFLDALSKLHIIPPGSNLKFTFGITVGDPQSTICSNLVAAPLTILMMIGASHMLRLKSYAWAKASAILAIVPLTAICCCIFTLPLGIWALIILKKPEVRAAFESEKSPRSL